jgi:glutathione synthase/RimK-type ligase-like ATP-grasp enzyme
MSRPSAIDAAECKPLQLALAKKIGFEIPSTRVVSSISDVGRVFREMGPGLVAKPVRSGFLSDGDGGFAMYTTRLTSEMLAASSNAVPTPIIVQKEIVKRSDIRVTVVGTQVFAAEILSQDDPSAIVDWRRTENPDLEHRRIDLPERVQGQCVQLLRGLNLTFGAIDLIRTADDSFVFLEINPSGQWLWIEDQLDYPISNAVADYLLGWIE